MEFLGQRRLTRRRYSAETVDTNGHRVRGAPVDVGFMGALQDLSGKDRQVLREGARSGEQRKVIACGCVLRAEDQRARLPADEVVVDGAVYVVTQVIRDGRILPHQSVVVTRRAEPK